MHEDEGSKNVKEKSESTFFLFSFVHIVKYGRMFGEVKTTLEKCIHVQKGLEENGKLVVWSQPRCKVLPTVLLHWQSSTVNLHHRLMTPSSRYWMNGQDLEIKCPFVIAKGEVFFVAFRIPQRPRTRGCFCVKARLMRVTSYEED